jgi:hypothetical protein
MTGASSREDDFSCSDHDIALPFWDDGTFLQEAGSTFHLVRVEELSSRVILEESSPQMGLPIIFVRLYGYADNKDSGGWPAGCVGC